MPRGEQVGTSKLKESEVLIIKRALADGINRRCIARAFHVGESVIFDILSEKWWKHVPLSNIEYNPTMFDIKPKSNQEVIYEITENDKQRFFSKVNKTDSCWLFTGSRDKKKNGYGMFTFRSRSLKAHRVSYFIHFGKFNENLRVCHKCDTPLCVNPNHLFLGTDSDNIKDMHNKGRRASFGGEANGNAKFTNEQVLEIRKLYATGDWSQMALARKFNTKQGQIWGIIHRKSWRHI